jgi:purine-nucleoside phosphorylase
VDHLEQQLREAVAKWDRLGWPRPQVAVVSGSGLAVELFPPRHGPAPLTDFLPFPVRSVEGHPHEIQLLEPDAERRVLYFRGRLHAYQGYDAAQTVFQVRLAALLGARVLIMTNAAGGLNHDYRPGQLVVVRDHLNLTGLNPLWGEPPQDWGPRFPDLGQAYDPDLRSLILRHATNQGLGVDEGVYAGLGGPSYETPAEVQMLRTLGADLVGMSTVLEVIGARHLGVRCACISLVANLATGVSGSAVDHEEVLAAGQAAAQHLQTLLSVVLKDPGLL